MEEQPSLISSKLFLKNRQVEVALSRAVLTWKEIKESKNRIPLIPQADLSHAVPVSEIVAVHKPEDEDQPQMRRTQKKNKESSQFVPYAFTVSYVRRMKQHQWQCSDVTFLCDSRGLCEQWIQVTNEQLSLLTNRPKSLLVYINPCGGKQRGKRIYEQKVAPVFRQAGIFTDVIVTERANHARDHLRTEANLDKYDGVVCVGGDGMFSEILHGLVIRTQRDHDVDQNRPDAELVSCLSRIGIIPAGGLLPKNTSELTMALSIVKEKLSDFEMVDLVPTRRSSVLLPLSLRKLEVNHDLISERQSLNLVNWCLTSFSGFKTFFCHNFYEGTVCFLPAEDSVGHPRDKLQCKSGCRICQHKLESKEKHKEMPEEKEKAGKDSNKGWNVVRGEFISVNSACMSCSCPRCPKGLSPSAHLADGTTDLILIKKCSRMNFFRHLFRHTNKQDQFDHSFVEVHRVKKFHFQPKVDSPEDQSYHPERTACGPKFSNPKISNYSTAVSSWTCDGEILHHAAIQVSVQHQLIRLFARGIEEQQ
ncbi:ceramide kinase-like [Nothobranchius furzeri]|uniref:Ceramide kinase-like n=1 Tax=Nothobranchius furzeri TaxID=105023 RepID=A0A9D2YZM2_NOTFU|nr:ceramide kinase-like [Nothobranchius furzeri]